MDKQYRENGPMEKVEEPIKADMDVDPIPRPQPQNGKGCRLNLKPRLDQVPWYTSGFQ